MTSPEHQLEGLGLSDDEAALIRLVRSRDDAETSRSDAWALLNRLLPLPTPTSQHRPQFTLAIVLGVIAGVLVRLPGYRDAGPWVGSDFYIKYSAFLVVPFVALYFARVNRLSTRWNSILVGITVALALAVGTFPLSTYFTATQIVALHVPAALLVTVALALTGDKWRDIGARLRVIKFAAEWFILFVLVGLGIAVLLLLFGMLTSEFGSANIAIMDWLYIVGPIAALVVTAALAAADSTFVSGACQLLVKIFVPLFLLMLLGLLGIAAWDGVLLTFQRNLLLAFDVLLLVVTALTSYHIASREPEMSPKTFDRLVLGLLVVASVIDAFALASMLARVVDIGFSLSRSVATGMNVVLLINLVMSAFRLRRFTSGADSFEAVRAWQARYLPVYFIWAAVAGLILPVVFKV